MFGLSPQLPRARPRKPSWVQDHDTSSISGEAEVREKAALAAVRLSRRPRRAHLSQSAREREWRQTMRKIVPAKQIRVGAHNQLSRPHQAKTNIGQSSKQSRFTS